MPPPSAELVALRVLFEAHFRTLKPGQKIRYQKALGDVLAEMEDDEAIVSFRPPEQTAMVREARGGARAWVLRVMRDILRREPVI